MLNTRNIGFVGLLYFDVILGLLEINFTMLIQLFHYVLNVLGKDWAIHELGVSPLGNENKLKFFHDTDF